MAERQDPPGASEQLRIEDSHPVASRDLEDPGAVRPRFEPVYLEPERASLLGACCRSMKSLHASPDGKRRPRSESLYMVLLAFLVGASYSVTLPSLFDRLESQFSIHKAESVLGLSVAVYCLGQFFGSFIFGAIGNRFSLFPLLALCLIFDIGGQLIYAASQSLTTLLIGRILMGLGSSMISLARSYMAAHIPLQERTSVMSQLSASQNVGYVYGPLVGSALTTIHAYQSGQFVFDEYTAPAYIQACMSLAILAILLLWFRGLPNCQSSLTIEVPATTGPEEDILLDTSSSSSSSSDESASLLDGHHESAPLITSPPISPIKAPSSSSNHHHPVHIRPQYDGMILCLFDFFITYSVFSVSETAITPTTAKFGWSNAANGAVFASISVLAILTVGLLNVINNNLLPTNLKKDIGFYLFALILQICSCFVVYSWTADLDPVRFLIGMLLLVGIGYVISSVECLTMYSKLFGSRPAGVMMGYATSVAATARIIAPLLSGYLYSQGGLDLLITVIFGVLCVILVINIIFHRFLIPNAAKLTTATALGLDADLSVIEATAD